MCLHICVCHCIPGRFQSAYYLWSSDGNTEHSLPVKIDLMFELGYLSLVQALCLCNLWKKKLDSSVWPHDTLQHNVPCVYQAAISQTDMRWQQDTTGLLTLYAAAQGVWLSRLGSHAGCGE